MAKRHYRRSTRPLHDLPSLFDEAGKAVPDDNVTSPELQLGSTPHPEPSADDDFAVPSEFTRPRSRLRFISFGSGSSGNCSYIGTPECGLLIDAGVDNNFVKAKLEANGIDINTIQGILLTHDHADHVRYSYAIVRHHKQMRLFATIRTVEGMLRRHNISRRIKDYHTPIFKEHDLKFGDIRVVPFETSHDGSDNVGYAFYFGNTVFVVATDMGKVTERADFYIRQATALMIESNYDNHMLAVGRYPEYLKARIRSEIGHMDNSVTANYLAKIYRPELSHIFLCHLSNDNNTPETATATALNALRTVGVTPVTNSSDLSATTVIILPLPRYDATDLYIFP